jgi:hypothetical protein
MRDRGRHIFARGLTLARGMRSIELVLQDDYRVSSLAPMRAIAASIAPLPSSRPSEARAGNHQPCAKDVTSHQFYVTILERFRAQHARALEPWVAPVRVKKTRQIEK